MPENPNPGECFVRCASADKDKPFDWLRLDCDLIKYKKLYLDFYNHNGVLSKKDKRKLDNGILRYLKKGYTIQLASHYDSKENDSIDKKRSLQTGIAIGNYLMSNNEINHNQLILDSYGSQKPIKKCTTIPNCDENYVKNTRIEYRVINYSNPNWVYDERGFWCKKSPED